MIQIDFLKLDMKQILLRFLEKRTNIIFDEQLVPDQNQLNNLKKVEKWRRYSRSKVGRSLT